MPMHLHDKDQKGQTVPKYFILRLKDKNYENQSNTQAEGDERNILHLS